MSYFAIIQVRTQDDGTKHYCFFWITLQIIIFDIIVKQFNDYFCLYCTLCSHYF